MPFPRDGILPDLIFPPACHCEHCPTTPVLGAPRQPPIGAPTGRLENGGSRLPPDAGVSNGLSFPPKGVGCWRGSVKAGSERVQTHRSVQFIKSSGEAASIFFFFLNLIHLC